jgi:tetratricopeptide (TPR) repeat protein
MFSFSQAVMALSITACSFPALNAAELVIALADNQSRPIKDVETRLLARADSAKEKNGTQYQKSNQAGIVRFESLEPGEYLFQAQKNGYVPLWLKLDLTADAKRTQVLLKTSQFEKLEEQAAGLREEGSIQESIEVLEGLLRNYPEDGLLHNRLAFQYADLPDPEKALAEAQLAAGCDAQFASSPDEVGRILLRGSAEQALHDRDFPTAIEKFEALTRADGNDPAGYHGLALAYGHTGRLNEALKMIEKAIALDPDDEALQQIRTILTINSQAQ